jgi:hypothetical protein
MRNGTGKGKLGYNKIRFCGEQRPGKMAYDIFGLTPAVSTRKSTPKLHALSIPCFAGTGGQLNAMYLSDVPSLARDVASETPQQPWEIDFRQSKWFTRGWTLQELLAPASVEFFSRECKRLCDKSLLGQLICEITNIPHSALQGDLLTRFSFQERLRWI